MKWFLRILGIAMFVFPFVSIALGYPNTSFLLIGMLGAILFIASFTFIKKEKG